jgi:hypothetical protein
MSAKKPDLIRRQDAIDATMAKFGTHRLELAPNGHDCAKLARFHLKQMGHKKLPATGSYTNALGARRALAAAIEKLTGKKPRKPTFEQLFDALLPRITPAMMLPGDLALVEEDPEQGVGLGGALVICVGRKWLSFHPDADWRLAVCEPVIDKPFIAAWRA